MPDPANKPVITRFAPSPTGLLHVGGARTALFSWAYARGRSGRFLLRLEDTDQKRSSEAAAEAIIADLRWLGLDWDNHDIPRQSQRLDRYNEIVERLKAAGHAYDDAGAVRFRMDHDVAFDDAVYGHIEVATDQLEDFVIKKADGFPTFHLAVVVDDIDSSVTHVIRGQEHLSNTAKHAALYDALQHPRPVWCHTPSILNPDGSKMSKRDKAKVARAAANAQGWPSLGFTPDDRTRAFLNKDSDDLDVALRIADELNVQLPEIDIADFRASGYLPEVLCNYLALLGWNPGNDVERFDLDYFRGKFDFDRINKANSKFDREKLAAFNGETLQRMPPEVFAAKLREHQPELAARLGDNFQAFCAMYQPRSRTLNDPSELGAFFFEAPTTYDEKAVGRHLTKNDGEGLRVLRGFRAELAALDPWTPATIQAAIEQFTATKQLKNMGSIAQPLRIAISGTAVTPPIDQTLALLGREKTLARIDQCLCNHEKT